MQLWDKPSLMCTKSIQNALADNNNGRDISRGIKSRQKSGRDGSGLGRPPRLFEISRRFGESRDISRLSLIFSLKSGRVGISSTFPNFFGQIRRDKSGYIPTFSSRLRGGSGSPISMQNRDWDEKKIPFSIFGRDRGGLPDSPRP